MTPTGRSLCQLTLETFQAFLDKCQEGVTLKDTTAGELKARSVEWTDLKEQFYRKILVNLPADFRFPHYVTFTYSGLDQEEKTIADAIIGSIRPGPEHQ
jgi:hypothetical protein